MRELGTASESEHRQLGAFADTLKLDRIITIGKKGLQIICQGLLGFEKEQAVDVLRNQLRPGDQVLFKASRGEGLETVLEELKTKI
jgi:UDP-N-acetylmuramoyl-tripeptide--D-alanyl-D-alanine ligase